MKAHISTLSLPGAVTRHKRPGIVTGIFKIEFSAIEMDMFCRHGIAAGFRHFITTLANVRFRLSAAILSAISDKRGMMTPRHIVCARFVGHRLEERSGARPTGRLNRVLLVPKISFCRSSASRPDCETVLTTRQIRLIICRDGDANYYFLKCRPPIDIVFNLI